MTEHDVYELFDSINVNTNGMFEKEYSLKKSYSKKAVDGQLEIIHINKTCVRYEPNIPICSGSPEKVYAFLTAFFRGLNFGIRFAFELSVKEKELGHDSVMAQILHKIK